MVKHLFSDIDGTLIQNGEIDGVTLTKIQKFIEEGNKFYLATGRIDSDIQYLIKNYFKVFAEYRISQNGTVITNNDNKIIYTDLLKLSNIQALLNYLFSLDKNRVVLEVSDITNRYLTVPRIGNYFAEFEDIAKVEPNLGSLIGSKIFPTIILLMSKDYDYLMQIQAYINANFNEITAVMTSEYLLEILNKTSSKGFAINTIVAKHSINKDDVYVVGDNENDISMFNEYKNSFVISSAKEHVKKHANYMVSLVGEVIDSIKY